jgi:polyphenol oxidase
MPMDRITSQLSVASGQLSVDSNETLTESGFYWRERDAVKVFVCRALEDAGFANGFSTRLGGVSNLDGTESGSELNLAGFNEDSRENIYENRRRFMAVFSREYSLATAWQVHGDNIRVINTKADLGDSDERADALVSNLDNILLGVKTADCVPILIGDKNTGAFAAVHAGWRGTVQRIVQKTVERLKETYDTQPIDLTCAIGPAAGCDRYEIGEEVMQAFSQIFSDSKKYFQETRPSHAFVDLKAANRDQLIDSGVDAANIHISPLCTMERPDLFFSYRLEKPKFGRTGRLMSVIGKL